MASERSDPPFESSLVDLHGLDALFKGFADPTRLRVLNALPAAEMCV